MNDIILLYLICCLLYCYIFLYRCKKKWLVKLLILLFFPLVGFILIHLMDSKSKKQSTKLNTTIPLNMLQQATKTEVTIFKEDVDKEINIIPIEDALLLNEKKVKRMMLLDLFKEESFQNMDALQLALENEDTETSHYAASAIMEIKRKLLNAMQSLEVQVAEHPADLSVLTSYSEVIKQYIQSGFLDDKTLKKYTYSYSNLLEKMIELDPHIEGYFIEKIASDLRLKEYEKAHSFCNLFIQLHPVCEDAYFLDMQINFTLKNAEGLQKSIDRLRNSSVKLSPSGLSSLRFWLQGE
ncbi:hypothetical protein IM538_22000 [Cytobacillus suaedae]|nr:hypothetical protein IM538_22000 [Cytobacillus suaedae]